MTIKDIKRTVTPIFKRYDVGYAGVFGSVARGEAGADSDIDFLLSFKKTPGLIRFIQLEEELKSALQTDVDMVVKGTEKKYIKPAIEKDLVVVYE